MAISNFKVSAEFFTALLQTLQKVRFSRLWNNKYDSNKTTECFDLNTADKYKDSSMKQRTKSDRTLRDRNGVKPLNNWEKRNKLQSNRMS